MPTKCQSTHLHFDSDSSKSLQWAAAVAKWQQSTQINGTPPLMNDTANCGNGLLLFGLDKYSDKWRALIIPCLFVLVWRQCAAAATLEMPAGWDELIKSDSPHSVVINNITAIKTSWWNTAHLVLTRLASWSNEFTRATETHTERERWSWGKDSIEREGY